ncbi:MAG TPA: HepT-like ribonuclease domain-containing protein [Armatimonadota bacterium]|jgi:uncharacterized protein with HEPN domain
MRLERDPGYLDDMLTFSRFAVESIRGRTRADLDNDAFFSLGMERLVEKIGEAARRLSPETREKHPEIAWSDIVGMRHHLAHGYDTVDNDMLWDTVTKDLPLLITALESVVPDEPS